MATTFQNVILVKYFAFYDGSNIVINNLEDDKAEYFEPNFSDEEPDSWRLYDLS